MSELRRTPLSGIRFCVEYRITGDEPTALARAKDICVEQTVEFPLDLVPAGMIREHVLGRVADFRARPDGAFAARISYAMELGGRELAQLLNVVFGNISLKPGIRVEKLDLPPEYLCAWPGPRFGARGLRERAEVPFRPLLCTALKPLGLSAQKLADLAYQFALGGIDLIKDDHGLLDQPFADFQTRVRLCAEAVARANQESGGHSLYLPNVTAGGAAGRERARLAKELGAGGWLVSPGLTGWDVMRELAEEDALGLPVLAHPAFLGTYAVSPDSGLSYFLLFGQLMRLAGADAVIYPNYGGRFSLTQAECQEIAAGIRADLGPVKPGLPCVGGGMTLDRVPELLDFYGPDVIFLIGGDLFAAGPDLVGNCRKFRESVERSADR